VGRARAVREEGVRAGPDVGIAGGIHQTQEQDPPRGPQGFQIGHAPSPGRGILLEIFKIYKDQTADVQLA
jgi:hypothetical protein